jgi:hypothetical protein
MFLPVVRIYFTDSGLTGPHFPHPTAAGGGREREMKGFELMKTKLLLITTFLLFTPPAISQEAKPLDAEGLAQVCQDSAASLSKLTGDGTIRSWDAATERERESVVRLVRFILIHPNHDPPALHDFWLSETEEGKANTVSFEDLPPNRQARYRLCSGVVHGLSLYLQPISRLPTTGEQR